MKKLILAVQVGLVALVLAVMTFGVAHAAETQKLVTLGKDEVFDGFFVRAGSIIKVNGTVNGDVFLAGQDITLAGRINGNVYAAAQTITIKGEVTGSVHLAAARVDISAPVDGTGLVAASDLEVAKEGSFGRGLVSGVSTADIAGKVGGPMYLGASTVNLENEVTGSATIGAEQIVVSGDGKFGNDLKYYSDTKDQVAKDKVAGQLTYVKPQAENRANAATVLASVIYGLLASLVLGLTLIYLAPRSTAAVADYIQRKPFVAVASGFGFVILVPLAVIFTFVTVIGIPLAVVVGLLYGVTLFVGELFVALWVGRTLLKTTDSKVGANALALLAGLVVLAALKLIPVGGVFVALLAFFAGVGALVARSIERISAVHRSQSRA